MKTMKRTLILLLLTVAGITSATLKAQVMNKGTEVVTDKVPAVRYVTCPYCQRKMSLNASKNHVNVCPYRYCIEYTYDAAGNRIQRAVVWTVSKAVKKESDIVDKLKTDED